MKVWQFFRVEFIGETAFSIRNTATTRASSLIVTWSRHNTTENVIVAIYLSCQAKAKSVQPRHHSVSILHKHLSMRRFQTELCSFAIQPRSMPRMQGSRTGRLYQDHLSDNCHFATSGGCALMPHLGEL